MKSPFFTVAYFKFSNTFYSSLTCVVAGNTNLIKHSFRTNNFEDSSMDFLMSHMILY